jgi:hypothetical protein
MVVKKKVVSVKASAPLEESVAKEEKRPPVTQVVEVVEETEPVVSQKPLEVPVITQEPVNVATDPSDIPTIEETDEKRKELVDELFQKKPQNTSSVGPEITIHTNRSSKPIVLWAIVLVVACLVAGGSLLMVNGKKKGPSIVSTSTPSAAPSLKVTTTPTISAIKRSDITIQVLNGGGVVGAATKMKTFLEGKGYSVSETGNADSYTYNETVISVKAKKKAYLSLLEGDLKDTYSLGTSSAALDDTVSYDARVTVGKK